MLAQLDVTSDGSPPLRNACFVRYRDEPCDTCDSPPDFRWLERITSQEIGESLGISRQAVCQRARRRGLPSRSRANAPTRLKTPPWSEKDFRAMYRAGVSTVEIAQEMGCSRPVVTHTARRLGLPVRTQTWLAKITLAAYKEQQNAQLSTATAAAEKRVAAIRREVVAYAAE